MKKTLFRTMCVGIAGMLFSGCANDDVYNPEAVVKKYEQNWEKKFGKTDPNQTWNTAKQVTANINLSNLFSGDYTVRIYTANPHGNKSALLAEKEINGKNSISFDIPQLLEYVFVTAQGNGRMAVNSYFRISNDLVNIAPDAKATTRAACPTTITKSYRSQAISFAHLGNVETESGITWKAEEWLDLVGENGIFAEGQHNLMKWKDRLGTTVEYVTTKEGPVTLSLAFGATQNRFKIGYFYYTDKSEANEAIRYVLFDKYNPCDYIKVDGKPLDYDMALARIGQSGGISTGSMIQGSKVSLTYFDESGTASYNFPKGTHIAFFVFKGGGEQATFDNTWNSISSTIYNEYLTSWHNNESTGIHSCAVTYKYGSQTIMGIEDGDDWDMNDLLFFVDGNIHDTEIPDIDPNPNPAPDAIPWIIACEDLGNTDDFDFNDIVFSVSHAAGSTEAIVTPLAAGGILDARIYYNDQELGEIHTLLGQSRLTITNTQSSKGTPGSPIKITVPETYSVTNDMGGFSIRIINNEKEATAIKAPENGTAPQMICIDGSTGWAWPTERTNISDAYPAFGEWGANYATNKDWYKNASGSVVK